MPRPRKRADFDLPIFRRSDELPAEEQHDKEAAVPEPPETPPVAEPHANEPDWWESPYKGGGPAKPKGFPRALYPPDSEDNGKEPSIKGKDVIAYKRTICKLGRWNPWDPDAWDQAFSNDFSHGRGSGNVGDSGVAGFQRQMGIQPTGWIGEQTFNALRYALVPQGPNVGTQAMDSVAVQMLNEAYDYFTAPPKPRIEDIEDSMYHYLYNSIASEPKLHYSQNRAMTHLGVAPGKGFTCDCSGHSTSTYYWAQQELGVTVPDPNGNAYNGYGYTGTLINNPKVGAPYKVGDLALYGPSTGDTSHVCTCMIAGSADESVWCSMGSEAAPYSVDLRYRDDLLCVVRPGLTP
jgi:hypothetical protein